MNEHQPITHGIVHAGFRGFRRFEARKKGRCKLIGNRLVIPHDTIPSNVTSKPKKKKDNDRMTMKFLLHKDKEKGNPPHFQAHLAAPTHRQPLRSQKSLHFSNALFDC